MANTIQIRRGTAGTLPTLAAGEPGFTTDTKNLYIGDGATNQKVSMDSHAHSFEASIHDNTSRIVYLEASVANLTTAINAVDESSWQASLHDNTSRISANETSITNLEASVAANTTAINNVSGGLTAWEENGSTLRPIAAGYDLGDTTHELGNVYVGDGKLIYFGNDQDLQMYHSGTLGQIRNTTGAMYLEQNTASDYLYIRTGSPLSTAITIDENQNVTIGSDLFIPDNQYIHFGDQKDGSLRWQTSISMLRLETKSTTVKESLYLQNLSTHADGALAITNLGGSSITIAQNNASGGIYLQTGTTPTDAFYVDVNQDAQFGGSAQWWDAERAYFGNGKDMDLYFSGAAGVLTCSTGYLEILSTTTDGLYLDNNASPGFVEIRTGVPLAAGLTIDEKQDSTFGNDVYIPGLQSLYFGDNKEFGIYTNTSYGYISVSNGFNFVAGGSNGIYFSAQNAAGKIRFRTGASATTALEIDEDQDAYFYSSLMIPDDEYIYVGSGNDLQIKHAAGVSSSITNYNTPFYLYTSGANAYFGTTTANAAYIITNSTIAVTVDSSQNVSFSNSITLTESSPNLTMGSTNVSTGSCSIELGTGRTDSGYAFIDLVGDTTYTDHGLRVVRNSDGANSESIIRHRGTGALRLLTVDAGNIAFSTSSTLAMTIDTSNDVSLEGSLSLNDSESIYLGTSSDCSIQHTGTHTIFTNSTGYIHINNTDTDGIYISATNASGAIRLRTGATPTSALTLSSAQAATFGGAVTVGSCGVMNAGASPTGTTAMEYNGYFYATRVYNAVYNDIADYQKIDGKHKAGMAYRETNTGLKLCNERCQLGVVGIYSDTYGYGLGSTDSTDMAPIAVAGWVLAYVDKEYEPGTPLTNDENGKLTEITLEEKRNYPERIIATYKQHERSVEWGPADNRIDVNNRHWVKVK